MTLEAWSGGAQALLAEDAEVAAWWATSIECASAIVRKGHSGQPSTEQALRELAELTTTWAEVPPTDRLRELAVRVVRVHELRTGDSLQLAAAIVASEERPETLELVTLDDRLALAASREGFRVLPA